MFGELFSQVSVWATAGGGGVLLVILSAIVAVLACLKNKKRGKSGNSKLSATPMNYASQASTLLRRLNPDMVNTVNAQNNQHPRHLQVHNMHRPCSGGPRMNDLGYDTASMHNFHQSCAPDTLSLHSNQGMRPTHDMAMMDPLLTPQCRHSHSSSPATKTTLLSHRMTADGYLIPEGYPYMRQAILTPNPNRLSAFKPAVPVRMDSQLQASPSTSQILKENQTMSAVPVLQVTKSNEGISQGNGTNYENSDLQTEPTVSDLTSDEAMDELRKSQLLESAAMRDVPENYYYYPEFCSPMGYPYSGGMTATPEMIYNMYGIANPMANPYLFRGARSSYYNGEAYVPTVYQPSMGYAAAAAPNQEMPRNPYQTRSADVVANLGYSHITTPSSGQHRLTNVRALPDHLTPNGSHLLPNQFMNKDSTYSEQDPSRTSSGDPQTMPQETVEEDMPENNTNEPTDQDVGDENDPEQGPSEVPDENGKSLEGEPQTQSDDVTSQVESLGKQFFGNIMNQGLSRIVGPGHERVSSNQNTRRSMRPPVDQPMVPQGLVNRVNERSEVDGYATGNSFTGDDQSRSNLSQIGRVGQNLIGSIVSPDSSSGLRNNPQSENCGTEGDQDFLSNVVNKARSLLSDNTNEISPSLLSSGNKQQGNRSSNTTENKQGNLL